MPFARRWKVWTSRRCEKAAHRPEHRPGAQRHGDRPTETADEPYFSYQQVAELYGISVAHVMFMALWRQFGHDTGDGRLMFSAADVAALRPRKHEHSWRSRSETDARHGRGWQRRYGRPPPRAARPI